MRFAKHINTRNLAQNLMDDHTYQNWVKIKQIFEQSGNTNNMFYARACEIVRTKNDPLEKFLGGDGQKRN